MSSRDPAISDAATVILVRDAETQPRVLLGQRGASAVFMPDKVVFPGGAVDVADRNVAFGSGPHDPCKARLEKQSHVSAEDLAAAAIREVFEETGLRLSLPGAWPDPPPSWSGFAEGGRIPNAAPLKYFFRAITPPGRPRRYDARFFLADAVSVDGDLDDFSGADAELSHLRWVPFAEVRSLNLAFITRLVLAELDRHLPSLEAPDAVPMVRNDAIDRGVTWLS